MQKLKNDSFVLTTSAKHTTAVSDTKYSNNLPLLSDYAASCIKTHTPALAVFAAARCLHYLPLYYVLLTTAVCRSNSSSLASVAYHSYYNNDTIAQSTTLSTTQECT